MSTDRLIYLPLGGAGEVGMNAYVYGVGPEGAERLILVDLGVTFPDMETTPGVDLIFPDLDWLAARADRLEAIFITHAHEDHVGALGHLWHRLKAPVHARPFTANIARRKMEEQGLDASVVRTVEPWPATVEAGPFRVSFVPVSHSIPESSGLVIDSGLGRVVHSGDFKVDATPVVGEPFDAALWREVAEPGVRALICDSTNVLSDHPGRSEASLGPAIRELVASREGMVVATSFASNLARLKTLAEAGQAAGRSVALLGRAMKRMIAAAQEEKVLRDLPGLISPEDAAARPRGDVMLIVTGSQGERRAASAQLSRGKYLDFSLAEGDLFLFSSKTIPGNERGVLRIVNAMSEMGVDVIDDASDAYHVSGHPNRPDLETMHDLVAPAILVPMHGEHRHLRAHARLAASRGVTAELAPNGTMLDLSGPTPAVAERIETGRVYLDGTVQIGARDGVVRDRVRMALNGHVTVTAIIDEEGQPLGEPWAEITGLAERGGSGTPLAEAIEAKLEKFMGRAEAATLADDDKIDEALRRIARQVAEQEIGRKPEVSVVVSRLLSD